MNKNQKHTPYTFSALIRGNRVVANFHAGVVRDIEFNMRGTPSSETREKLNYHRTQIDWCNEEYRHLVLVRACCGDGTVLIRQQGSAR